MSCPYAIKIEILTTSRKRKVRGKHGMRRIYSSSLFTHSFLASEMNGLMNDDEVVVF